MGKRVEVCGSVWKFVPVLNNFETIEFCCPSAETHNFSPKTGQEAIELILN